MKKFLYCLLVLGLVGMGIGLVKQPSGPKAVAQVQTGAQTARLIVYLEEDFQGPSLEVTTSLLDMPKVRDENGVEIDWNDEVRSMVVVSGTWRLYRNGRCNTKLDETPLEALDIRTKEHVEGWSALVSASSRGPLRISNPAAGGFEHDISSIELVSQTNLPDLALPSR